MRLTCLVVSTSLLFGSPAALAQASSPAAPDSNSPYEIKAPANAPNVVIVLLDDVGFGAASTFGGPVATPALDALARDGLRYNRFHTTAICSPTRSSLLTGRNPHATGIGTVTNTSDARPGYSGFHTKDTSTIARILRGSGYSTAAFGKWHQTPDWEASPAGPFDRWPTGEGFERFYGFMGGETDQYDPTLYDGVTPIVRPAGNAYHLTEDLAAKAIEWLHTQKAVTPDKPVLLYFAPGATHAPFQAPKAWIERYRGRFDGGWDALRQEIFARQKKLGVIPADTVLTPRDPQLPAWSSLAPDQKRIAARLMEVYAGFLAHTDAQVGKLIDALKAEGKFDNTLFFYVVGDNGASGEGGLLGSADYMGPIQGLPEPDAVKLQLIDKFGAPGTYPHFNSGWAWAMNTPFRWMKTVASHLGGTRNGLVVSWPRGIHDHGGLRSQFSHVNDIAPTILEAAGIPAPATVDGVPQKPMNGASLVYSFDAPRAPERHDTQYFEVYGHRAIYHAGWIASAFHSRLPWAGIDRSNPPFEADRWELYDLRRDFSQAHDLASTQPAKLAELKDLFLREAAENQVLPLTNNAVGNAAGLPSIRAGRTIISYPASARGIPESAVPRIFNRSWSVDAAIDVAPGSHGVIAALGGRSAGWSLSLDADQRPSVSYRLFDLQAVNLRGAQSLAPGRHALRLDFHYDGGGFGKGGTLTLIADGQPLAEERLVASPTAFFTIDETFDVGIDRGSPAGDYPPESAPGYPFAGGAIETVTISAK